MGLVFALVLMMAAIAGVVIRKTYYYLPLTELKRQAERHDPTASRLYRAVAYGSTLRSLLWLWIGITSAGGIILLARQVSPWLSLLTVLILLLLNHSWLPATRVSSWGVRLTLLVNPVVTWLLNYAHPILNRVAGFFERRYSLTHTGLFERSDLVALIERQQRQADNRLTDEELEIVKRALSFSEYHVSDVAISRKEIPTVTVNDTVGPVLIDELHKSGQNFAVVRETPKGPFVGTVALKRLGIKTTGKIQDIMDSTVYYLHENDSLSEALHAFFVTNHPVFLVVNSFEEYVGILTIESVLYQLLGHVPGDDFDQYTDFAAVAARHAKKPSAKTGATHETVKTDSKVVE